MLPTRSVNTGWTRPAGQDAARNGWRAYFVIPGFQA